MPRAVEVAARKSLAKGGEEIAETARQFAPYKSGALHASINWTFGDVNFSGKETAKIRSSPGGATETGNIRVTVFVGEFYGRFVEFGTVNMDARPFFFPAYRVNKKRVKNRIVRNNRNALKEAVK